MFVIVLHHIAFINCVFKMSPNVKIPKSYHRRIIFNKARTNFIKEIRSNIERAISSQLLKIYKDKEILEMQDAALSPAGK